MADLVSSPDPFALPIREEDLARLELCLRDSVLGDDAFLNEVASHLIRAGGKRLRPSLAIAASYLQNEDVTTEILLPPAERGERERPLGQPRGDRGW